MITALPTTALASTGGSALGSLLVLLLLAALSLGPIITYIIIVVANRADPDPSGKRPMAVYLFGGAFLTLWLTVLGLFLIVESLIGLIGTTYAYNPGVQHPVGDAAFRTIFVGLLLVVFAGGAHVVHRRRGLQLAASEEDPSSPTKRVGRSYVAILSFLSVLVVVVLLIVISYLVATLIAPGIFDYHGSTTSMVKVICDLSFLALLFAAIFVVHQRLAPAPLRLFAKAARTSNDHDHHHEAVEAAPRDYHPEADTDSAI